MINETAIISVSGFASNVGKTTLMCDLIPFFPGWEAIKITRGHYRSCGKDAHQCCVSHLLADAPTIHSDRSLTRVSGKDTGRYWEAGAANVHWLIVTEEQVERGINLAIQRVAAPGVLVEGTSFARFVDVDFALMVASLSGGKIKPSAKRAMAKVDAIFLSRDPNAKGSTSANDIEQWLSDATHRALAGGLPVFTRESLPQLVSAIQERMHIGERVA